MHALLGPDDPPPFRVENAAGTAPLLLLCDHASRAVPKALGNLGLSEAELSRHIGWDIGAAEVATHLAHRLDAPLVMSGYSRLVVDCNRHLHDPTSMPVVSDRTEVPGNRDLSEADRQARAEACFYPYHREIDRQLDRFAAAGILPYMVVIHSFTPAMNAVQRPWHVGVLWNEDDRIAVPLLAALRRRGELVVGDNEPYSGKGAYEYTIRVHTEARAIPHVSIEIRQDLIGDPAGCLRWADILAPALAEAMGLEMRAVA